MKRLLTLLLAVLLCLPSAALAAEPTQSYADFENSKVKAFASANIGPFAVHGLRVIDGEKGMFVAMPSTSYQKDGKTEYQETFHPVSGEARKALNDAVIEAYEQKLAEEQTEDEALDEEQTEDQSFTQTM